MAVKKIHSTQYRIFVLILFASLVIQPMNLLGQPDQEGKSLKIGIKNNRISVDVKDVYLSDVLMKIGSQTGVKTTVHKDARNIKITAKFQDLDIESAFKKILGSNYVFVFYKNRTGNEKFVLKEVMAAREGFGSDVSEKGGIITREFEYGPGNGQMGVLLVGEGGDFGPQSFAIDNKGNIYILDSVNERMQIFSANGQYLSTISLGITPRDVAIDELGHIYIHNGHELYQFDLQGNIISEIDLVNGTAGGVSMYVIDNKIYVKSLGERDKLIGRIKDGILKAPTDIPLYGEDEYIGLNGRKYLIDVTDLNEVEIKIIEKDSTTKKIVTSPVKKDTLFTNFLGEDSKENLYFQSQRDKDGKGDWVVEIHRINSKGNNIETIEMPDEATLNSHKEYVIGKNGTIYSFMPGRDKLRLHIFPPH